MSVFFIETLEPGVPRGNRRLQEPDKDPPLNSGIKGHFLQGENFGRFLSFFADSAQTEYCTTFHCSFVRPSVCHRRDISHFSHI